MSKGGIMKRKGFTLIDPGSGSGVTSFNKGFTLIELLVVIAIVALLLSVLLPSLNKAKRYARRIIDTTNLRSLATALHIYLNNSNDKFFDYDIGADMLWMDRVGDSIDNLDAVRYCPETVAKIDEVRAAFNGTSRIWATSTSPWLWNSLTKPSLPPALGSYGLNGWFYRDTSWVAAADKLLLYGNRAGVRSPSTTPMVLDANWVDGWPKNTNTLTDSHNYLKGNTDPGNSSNTTMIGRFLLDRHGPETNVIFLDGSVTLLPHKDLWTLSWHKGSQPNYNAAVPRPIPAKK